MLGWIFVAFAAGVVLERARPGWRLPRVRTWAWRVVVVNAVQLAVVVVAGVTWERWAQAASLLDLGATLPPAAGGLVAYVAATFVFYWWHRWRHESDWLWVHFHQVHHSPQRLEVVTSFYKHPLEMIVNSMLGAVLAYALLGLTPAGGAVYTLCTALGEFFYHANCRTPHWVGYLFQRPEMHRIHHEHGRHRDNYGDLALWDMLFGTWRNPPDWNGRCGFDAEQEERLAEMLRFRDVHPPREPR